MEEEIEETREVSGASEKQEEVREEPGDVLGETKQHEEKEIVRVSEEKEIVIFFCKKLALKIYSMQACTSHFTLVYCMYIQWNLSLSLYHTLPSVPKCHICVLNNL